MSNGDRDNVSPDLKLPNLVLVLKQYEQVLFTLSISKYGIKSDSELHHAICVARKELEVSLLNLQHGIDSLKTILL